MLGELTSVIGSIVGRDTSRCPNVPALLRAYGLPVEVVESLTRITVIGAVETTSRLIAETAIQAMLLEQQHAPLSTHLAVRAALGAHPPLRHVLRRSRRHITVTGETIPAGALVLVRLADGPPGAAFGVGVHRCPGRAHALALAHDVARSWTGWSARLAHVRADYGAPDLAIFGGPQTVHVTRLAGGRRESQPMAIAEYGAS